MSEFSDSAVASREVAEPTLQIKALAPVLTPSSLLARNAVLNFIAEGWTLVVLLAAMPKLVSAWGETSFGLFSLAWVVIGYLTFLDIGVNRAATKFVSEHLASDEHGMVRSIVGMAIWCNLFLGLLGGCLVLLLSPYLVHSVFKISGSLQREASLAFYAVALAVPVLLVQGILRAVLTSYQRFGWINSINAVTMTAQWGAALLLAWSGRGVAIVVLATVIVRALGTLVYGLVLQRLLPGLQLWKLSGMGDLFKLLKFGSWVSVSQLISPLLVYLDRILIAAFVSLGAVTVYTVPFEAMTRLRILPVSLVNTLYPAFSERSIDGHEAPLQRLYEGSVRYLLILMFPFIIVLAVLGRDVLSLWMGAQFANRASIVLEILSLGILLNCMATIPYNALQALGRPDLTGKFHLLELPLYLILCLFLIPHWGIVGAAIANSIRVSGDAILLFWAASRFCGCSMGLFWKGTLPKVLSINLIFTLTLLGLRVVLVSGAWERFGMGAVGIAIYSVAVWILIIGREDRQRIRSVLRLLDGHSSRSRASVIAT